MVATTVDRKVQTTFTIKDKASQASGMLGRNMKSAGDAISRATGMFRPLNMAIGAFASALATAGVAKLGDQFEQTQMQMAGFLSALGFTKDFNEGLKVGAQTMEQIRISAAALPGEAEDYIEVFKSGLPVLQASVGGTLSDMISFSNQYAAITKTLGVDAQQAARDIALMLRAGPGGAGMDVRAFMTMLPFMKKVEGQANLTRDSFNKMTAPERAQLLGKTFQKLQPMLDHASNTFDAMWGGFQSNSRMMLRLSSAPLFEGMKKTLTAVNNSMFTAGGQMTDMSKQIVHIGKLISTGIGGAFAFITSQMQKMVVLFGKFASSPGAAVLGGFINQGIGAAKSNPGGAAAVGGGAAALLMGAGGPIALLVGGLVDFAGRTEAVTAVLGELSMLGSSMLAPFGQMIGAFTQVSGVIADIFEGALGGFINMITNVVTPVLAFLGGALQISADIVSKMRPTFMMLWKAIGNLFQSIGKFLNPIIRIAGAILLNFYKVAAHFLVPVINLVVDGLSKFVDALAWVISKIGGWLGKLADKVESDLRSPGAASKSATTDFMAGLFSGMKPDKESAGATVTGPSVPKTPKARGGGGRSVQDFRYSRFTIDQKFAEGFDPDRIAVAFARDLGKIGEQRLQSGFEPLFGIS